MHISMITFGTLVDGQRVVGRCVTVLAGIGRMVVLHLEDGGTREVRPDGWLDCARPGRRDLAAGPVRAAKPAELKSSVRESQGRKRGDESGFGLATRRTT